MTLVMAYCVLLSATMAAVATVGDYLLRSRRLARRWLWLIAMMLVVPMTAFVMLAPRASESAALSATIAELPLVNAARVEATPVEAASSWLPVTDVALTLIWAGASVLLFTAIGIGRWRVAREKARARRGRVQGHEVLLTSDLGPAVAGVRQPMVFVPDWVVALDDSSQRLLLAHEVEHARRRDTAVLMAGAALNALLPWNPVVWWMARRLRVAVELDCDARVLESYPDVRRYADLLLVAAGKPRFTSRFLAAHFGEHASDLERRIDAMTNRRWKIRSFVLASVAAAGLAMASCEAPRPEPVAPLPTTEKEVPAAITTGVRSGSAELADVVKRCASGAKTGCQLSVIVRSSEGKEMARFAGEVPVAQLSEGSIQSIEVEKAACGTSTCSLIWITLKPGELLKKESVASNELRPGGEMVELRIDDQKLARRRKYELFDKVRVLLSDSSPVRVYDAELRLDSSAAPMRVSGKIEVVPLVEGPRVVLRDSARARIYLRNDSATRARISLRDESAPTVMPNVVIYSSTGAVVREIAADVTRINSKSPLGDIKSDDIDAIEVLKGSACASGSSLGCPLVKITLKPGREQAYRKR
jgi:beta-lactamase regulating signal transducer with metallopeptidase domain